MTFVRRNPLVSFFVLAYGLSWAYWIPLALAGVRTAPGSSATHEPGLLGPALAAFIITGLTEGRAGVVAFARRLVLVSRPTSRFLIYSLSPLMFLGLAIVVAIVLHAPLPPWSEFAIYSGLPPLGLPAVVLLVLLFNGFGEEAGWRGFALEPLQRRHGPVAGTLILAALWAGWHTPAFLFPPSTLLVRTAGAPDRLAARMVETIRQRDPNRPIDHVQTLEEIRDETIAPQRLNATLVGLFAVLALAIATVGVAGVLAFSVSQRTNELGIRVALGAERGTILRMILGEGAVMALIGLAVGGLAAVPLSQLLNGLLFGIEPADPPTIALAALLLVAVAVGAAFVPARRATAVDPITALRSDG